MRKKLGIIFLWILVSIGLAAMHYQSKGSAEEGTLNYSYATRSAITEGENRTQVAITIGSETPKSPFSAVPTGGSSVTANGSIIRNFLPNAISAQFAELRKVSFVNDTSYYVYLGTWPKFTPSQAFHTVDRSSIGRNVTGGLQNYATLNRATFWMLIEEGQSTQTVKVNFEKN